MRTLVVIATHNEIERVEDALRRTRARVPDADVLVVDDQSADGTAARADQLAAELGGVEVLRRPEHGRAAAQRAGLRIGLAKGYDLVAVTDPELAPEFRAYSAGMLRGADIDRLPADGHPRRSGRGWWDRRRRRRRS